MVEQYQNDIVELESKIAAVREKQKVLIQRHEHAHSKKRVQENIRRADTSDVFVRFDSFERRIDRLEAEGELVNFGREPSLNDKFAELADDEDLEKELDKLRDEVEDSNKA